MKRNEGFTLVELLVAMVVGSIVTLAATSVLLLGLRYNAISIGAAQRQNTTRIIMSLLEGVASEGRITGVESHLDSWKVLGEEDTVYISYHSGAKAIYANEYPTDEDGNIIEGGTKLLENVIAAHVSLADNGLITLSVETEDGSYTSSVHCRNYKTTTEDGEGENGEDQPETDTPGTDQELIAKVPTTDDFLQALLSQYRLVNGVPNPGMIVGGENNGTYYATWYANQKQISTAGWDSGTPWCACFISWAIRQVDDEAPIYANVDTFMSAMTLHQTPAVGDIVFFDWEGGNDPEHVGVVLLATEGQENAPGFIYTIEGNSAGLVAMRMYSAKDPAIIGYGKLNFSSEEQTNQLTGLKKLIFEEINRRCVSTIEYEYILDSQADDCAANDRNPENETWNWGEILRSVKGVDQGQGLNIVSMVDHWIAEYPGIAGESPFATHCVIGVSGTGDETKIIVVFTG